MGLLVDVHAHLDVEQFKEDIEKVIARAKDARINTIICNAASTSSMTAILELCKKHKEILKAALGIFPVDAAKLSEKEFNEKMEFIKNHKDEIVAIGEVGMDYHWDKDPITKERQKIIFREFIKLAKKLDKPLIVHTWDAEELVVDILEEEGAKKVVMHCFSGNMKLAKRIEKNKWMFSIPTNIVFSEHFQNVVKNVDISQILTETDSPWLSPIKGKRNEPANIALSIRKIAEVKKMTVEETEKVIYMNYQKMFC